MIKGKILLVFIAIFLVFSLYLASADLYVREVVDKNYLKDTETWVYREDLSGHHRGFTLTHTVTSPRYSYVYEDYYPDITWAKISRPNTYARTYSPEDREYGLDQAMNTYTRGQSYGRSYSRYGGYRSSYW